MADILRISVIGSMPSGEVWSVNPVFSIGGDFGAPVTATQAKAVADACAAAVFPTTIASVWAAGTTQHTFRVEARSLAGLLEAQAETVRTTPVNGTASAPHPYQTSAVVSLRTAATGAKGRGRLYWPATGMLLNATDYRIVPATLTSFLAGMKTFLSALNTAVDASFDGVSLAVWSRSTASKATVNQIQVGNVLDTQRRRRDALIENYSALPFP